jgi:hypothetical protein
MRSASVGIEIVDNIVHEALVLSLACSEALNSSQDRQS